MWPPLSNNSKFGSAWPPVNAIPESANEGWPPINAVPASASQGWPPLAPGPNFSRAGQFAHGFTWSPTGPGGTYEWQPETFSMFGWQDPGNFALPGTPEWEDLLNKSARKLFGGLNGSTDISDQFFTE